VRSTVENVLGGPFGDILRSPASSSVANRVIGAEGDDTIDGGGGADDLQGSVGDDELRGEDGADRLSGGSDADEVEGGPGDDEVLGDDGDDTVDGGEDDDTVDGGAGDGVLDGGLGADALRAQDGRLDTVRCGDGADSVLADPIDLLAGCEDVTIVQPEQPAPPAAGGAPSSGGPPAPSTPVSGPPGPTTTTLAISLSARTITATRGGVVTLVVACPPDAAGGCAGFVSLATAGGVPLAVLSQARRRKVLALGRARFRVGPGGSARVAVRLSKQGRRALRKLRRLRVKVTTTRTGARSERPTRLGTIVLRAPRRR
jgi:hypothetical protein